ncbi:MAG: universal stress protein [Sphingobacteriales bacterium]|nr:MAG: universal stress protein [Sphingobacteriales bacterium]
MNKRFIILIDFSEYSNNLIMYACDWSKQANAEILLVHQSIVLVPALTDNESRQQITQHTNEDAIQKLKELAKEIIPPTVKVSFNVSESNLQITLPKLLSEPFDNLIFTGIKGTGLLKKIFLGSTALRIIDSTKNIIVAMPKEIKTFSHDKIYVGVTEKHPLNILELNKFLNFIDTKNMSITFFYLAKPNEKTTGIEKLLNELKEMFSEKYKTSIAIYEGNNPFNDIKKIINNNLDELLIVQKGSRLLTDQLFRRFLINELVYEGQTPLIVLP